MIENNHAGILAEKRKVHSSSLPINNYERNAGVAQIWKRRSAAFFRKLLRKVSGEWGSHLI
jgi:hypothetical protein